MIDVELHVFECHREQLVVDVRSRDRPAPTNKPPYGSPPGEHRRTQESERENGDRRHTSSSWSPDLRRGVMVGRPKEIGKASVRPKSHIARRLLRLGSPG